jgi:serine/threonine-protein kinase
MALAPGTRFGLYEITASLGAGGMGEVYRARDTKLGREVAIKTLPATFAGDKERLARFEREAKLLAALNHAHIASVYALDEHAGTLYLAMELVEGDTLEKKLRGGAPPIEDALRIALQIAQALEAAHGKGVIHRDLKPANVMVTRDGQVKVLDFGLAKAFAGAASEASPAHSPALSVAMTQKGLVLGTAGYMSPEQASGQATDQRADIWAFGVVLYEMLTGLPLFSGESVQHVLADVLKTEPDWARLPKNLHPRLKLLLERCLTKKPHNRLHSIADARVDIDTVLRDPRGATPGPAVGDAAVRKSATVLRLAGAGVAIAVAGLAGWLLRPAPAPEPKTVVRFSVPLLPEQWLGGPAISMLAVSPDGTRVAFSASNPPLRYPMIFLRNLGESEARPVPGTGDPNAGAAQPAFSPDGLSLAYVDVRGDLGPFIVKRVPVGGGAPVAVHEATFGSTGFPKGLTWPTAETILFANAQGIVRVPANGGATEVLVPRGEDERLDSPQLLPGGEAVLFTRVPGAQNTMGGFEAAQVVVQSIGRDDRTVVLDGGSAAKYLPTGHLVYAEGTALFAIPFDPAARTVRGGPVRLVEGLRRSIDGGSDTANFAVADTGTLALIPVSPDADKPARGETTLAWVDREGREIEPFPVRPAEYTWARISPDGTKVALVIGAIVARQAQAAIWIFDRRTENLSLLTAEPGGDDAPVWSSDGSRIFFRSFRDDRVGVYAIEVATGETTLLAASSPDFPIPRPETISPDDRTLALLYGGDGGGFNIAALSLPDLVLMPLLNSEALEGPPSIAPNGAAIAYYELLGGGTGEIYIRPFPAVSRTRILVGPGLLPVFSRDGAELFFVASRGLWSAPVTYEPTLRVGTPRRLFEGAFMWDFFGRAWDVDPSGERFLVIRAPGSAAASLPTNERIDVVLNWFEELESRVPVE